MDSSFPQLNRRLCSVYVLCIKFKKNKTISKREVLGELKTGIKKDQNISLWTDGFLYFPIQWTQNIWSSFPSESPSVTYYFGRELVSDTFVFVPPSHITNR